MIVRWLGQSAFLVSGSKTVLIDPFGAATGERLAARGMEFRYPPIEGISADLVLVTHEHSDHNGVEAAGGAPAVLRSTAGRLESPVGEVLAIASEHDDRAGTARGPNTIFCLTLDGVRLCHLGDFGQPALRPEQREAIGDVDVLFVPVGGGPTIGGEDAAELARSLAPRVVFPMHYRTEAVGFLEPADAFLDALGGPVERPEASEIELDGAFATQSETVVVLLAPPLA
jgi:L-ascorbate metabolism protein UlaG (beta-lactamase superfamily)